METNNNCQLPCFWGITPGKTTWLDANQFLQTLSSVEFSHNSFSGVSREFSFDIQQPGYVGLHRKLRAEQDVVSFLQVSEFDSPSYHLAAFLSTNGKPDEVVLRTYQSFYSNTSDLVPFLIYMYYKDEKMLVAYGYGNGEMNADSITGCVTESPSVQIWAHDRPRNPDDAMQLMGWYDPDLFYLSISDATGGNITVDTFYETFKDKNIGTSFQTPLKLWPVL